MKKIQKIEEKAKNLFRREKDTETTARRKNREPNIYDA